MVYSLGSPPDNIMEIIIDQNKPDEKMEVEVMGPGVLRDKLRKTVKAFLPQIQRGDEVDLPSFPIDLVSYKVTISQEKVGRRNRLATVKIIDQFAKPAPLGIVGKIFFNGNGAHSTGEARGLVSA